MTSREIMRTALQLGGVWIVVSGFSSIESVATLGFSVSVGTFDFGTLVWSLGSSALAFVLLALLPGLYVISRSENWAAWIVSDDGAPAELTPSLFLASGSMLLGLLFLVDGAIGILMSPLLFAISRAAGEIGEAMVWNSALPSAARGILELGAGLLVLRYGRSLVNHAV